MIDLYSNAKLSRVDNIATLKAMAKVGLIELHSDTGRKVGKSTLTYVNDGKSSFQFGSWNEIYVLRYVPGCFCPYVFRITDCNAAFSYTKTPYVFEFIINSFAKPEAIDTKKYVLLPVKSGY